MALYQGISQEEKEAIVDGFYLTAENFSKSQNEPTLVLVGAQAGSGKTDIANIVKDELIAKGGYIHVDADRLREKINVDGYDTKPRSEETQQDASSMVQMLRVKAVANRRNILEEGTFRTPEHIEMFINRIKEHGYRVEMVALAVHESESKLGVYRRFESQILANTDNPRFVPEDYQDNAYNGFAKTIQYNQHLFDRIRALKRDKTVIYDSAAQSNRYESASVELQAGREPDLQRVNTNVVGWTYVKQMAQSRDAYTTQIRIIKATLILIWPIPLHFSRNFHMAWQMKPKKWPLIV